jgi:FSR family fosmidomycin resistance protein-like MFS transporter
MTRSTQRISRGVSGSLSAGVMTFLLIEFYDELAWTLATVATPFIRDEFDLAYSQVGLLLGLPILLSSLIEPIVLLLGDTPLRSRVILGGGLLMGGAFALAGGADTFALLVPAMALSATSSGAFVSLSQAVMIGRHPAREPEMMARWTVAGTLGDLLGPAALGAALLLGASWREALVLLGAAALALALRLRTRLDFPPLRGRISLRSVAKELLENLRIAARVPGLRRWLLLLPLSDLMLDVFFGFVAVYLVDVDRMKAASAALAATLWLLGFLAGQVILIRALARHDRAAHPAGDGRRLVRLTAFATVPIYAVWLLTPIVPVRLALLPVLGLLASPWYPVLQGEAYATMPGRPATVAALTSVSYSVGGLLAVAVGLVAARSGLPAGMVFLAVGPLALWALTPNPSPAQRERRQG